MEINNAFLSTDVLDPGALMSANQQSSEVKLRQMLFSSLSHIYDDYVDV